MTVPAPERGRGWAEAGAGGEWAPSHGPALGSPQTGPVPTPVPPLCSLPPRAFSLQSHDSTAGPVHGTTVALAAARMQPVRGSLPDAVSGRQPPGPLPDGGTDCRVLEGLLSPSPGPWAILARLAPRGTGEWGRDPRPSAQVPAPGELVGLGPG